MANESKHEWQPETVLTYWFSELTNEERFGGGETVDTQIAERFSELHAAATHNELWSWRTTARGALAEIIVLDQFSRNLHRGTAPAFASDAQALALAQVLVAAGSDQTLTVEERLFVYLPYMHSESRLVHEEAVRLFTALGDDEALRYEHVHRDIIEQFGRYPHRNEQLGRESTPAELAYLEETQHDFFSS